MSTGLLFGDAEAAVVVHLKTKIPNLKAGSSIPKGWNPEQGSFLRVGRIGGRPLSPATELAVIDLEVYSANRADAHDLLQQALAVLRAVTWAQQNKERAHMYAAKVAEGPQYLADPVTKEPRWIATVEVTLRGGPKPK